MKSTAVVVRQEPADQTSVRGLHDVVVEEVELSGPGEGEVLVEIMVAGVCHSDLSVVNGDRPRPLPLVLGHEASGVVRDVGPGVSTVRAGDTVVASYVPACGVCAHCSAGRPALCQPGNKANGAGTLVTGRRPFTDSRGGSLNQHLGVSAFSRYTVVSEHSLVRVDSASGHERLAVLGCAVVTGVGAVLTTARVEPGSSIAVFGCGGVGLSAILGARAIGAGQIIAIDMVPARLARASEAGADVTLQWSEGVANDIRDLTRGGVAYAFEMAGRAESMAAAYQSTSRGGTVIVVGMANPSVRFELSPSDLAGSERAVLGSYMGSAVPRRDIPRYLAMYESGRLRLDVLAGDRFPLAQTADALNGLIAGHVGRQLIDCRDASGIVRSLS